MSGFAALVQGNGRAVEQRLLRRMTRALEFRGPDGLRTHAEAGAGLGHALNAVTSDSGGNAGQFAIDGDLWLAGDFRLDDRESLSRSLDAAGFAVSANAGDGALLCAAYRAWGTDCVSHLLGDFAFTLWDSRKKRLFGARDHFGVKPFFYAHTGGGLAAGSALEPIRMLPGVSNTLDERTVVEFLAFGFNPDPGSSIFADIRRLPPAHSLAYEDGRLRIERYWSLPVGDTIRYRKARDYLDQLRALLKAAVGDRLRSDRVGIQLSGGLDSTAIAATVRELDADRPQPTALRGHTLVFDHLIPDEERRYAALAARHLEFPVDFLSADGLLPYAEWDRSPEPLHAPYYFAQRGQYRATLAHSPVALCGHGGDELLYRSYATDLIGHVPWTRLAADLLSCLIRHQRRPALGLRALWERRRQGADSRYACPPWIRPELARQYHLEARFEDVRYGNRDGRRAARPEAYRRLSNPAVPVALETEDANFTRVPLEVRYPFLDLRMVQFLLSVPPIPWCVDKLLIREAMADRLPPALLKRPKTPLAADPLAAHLRTPGAKWIDNATLPPALDCYIDRERLPPVQRALESPGALWSSLAPLSLGLWLECNETSLPKQFEIAHDHRFSKRTGEKAREKALP